MFHNIVVDNIDYTREMEEWCEVYVYNKYGIKQKCDINLPKKKYYRERKLEVRRDLAKYERKCKELQRLERLEQLQQLQRLQELQQLEQLERLGRLGRLEQLQQLQGLQGLNITNLSFENVKIETPIDETIIYIDPPYFNTGEYKEKVCHKTLLEYIKNSPYKVYISSYDMPFNEVASWEHRSTLSSTANNKVYEKLYCNKEENDPKCKQLDLFSEEVNNA